MRGLCLAILTIAVASSVLSACKEEKHYYVQNIGDGEEVPTMSTTDVNTFISDSGYTKYYIKTPVWDMYEESRDPYWFFPKGVELEQYDTRQKIEATLRCDSAKYLSQQRLWRLDGRVVMVNVARDSFLTNQVYWDQSRRKIYSDSFIHIVKEDRIIEGYGFESNEAMTAYTVQRPTGIFPVDRQDSGSAKKRSAEAEAADYDEDMRRAPAPRRASERADDPIMYHHDQAPSGPVPQMRPVPGSQR